jgi:hypothetical protein
MRKKQAGIKAAVLARTDVRALFWVTWAKTAFSVAMVTENSIDRLK